MLIELKTQSTETGRLEGEVARLLEGYDGEVALQSFDPVSLGWFRRHSPRHARGQLASGHRRSSRSLPPWQVQILRRLQLNHVGRPDFIGYDVRDLPCLTAAQARRAGLPILAWTVRTSTDRARARRHADGIIFEDFRP